MNPKISVIIPVYGVEKYLDRCVESVVNQTYKDLEIILVDDGSPDNCPKMCDEWALRDVRIRTVHRENGGLSCARNTGLSVATGDYVTFVDSDDWIALDTYEYCMGLFFQHDGADAVQIDFAQISKADDKIPQAKETVEVYQGKDILEFYMTTTTTTTGSYSVCRCLFKTSMVKNHRFREGKIYEDIDFKYKVLRDCREMVASNMKKYFYWQEGNSTSSGKFKERDFQLYEAAEELCKLTQTETYGDIAFLGRVKKARTPFSLLSRIAIWGVDDSVSEKETISKLLKENRRSLPILLKAPLPLSRKITAVLFAIDFRATRFLLRCAMRAKMGSSVA